MPMPCIKAGLKLVCQVGICSVWYQGNPCNMHLLSLGDDVKKEVDKDILAIAAVMFRL